MKFMAPSFETVYNWVTEFKRDRTSTCDEPLSECSAETATPEIIEKVHDMILNNRRMKVWEIVEAMGIAHGMVITIFHEKLSMKKLSAR